MIINYTGTDTNDQITGCVKMHYRRTNRILIRLQRHIIENKKDNSGKRGLQRKVSARKALLAYLQRKDIQRYRDIIAKLNLRGIGTVEDSTTQVAKL